MFVDITIIPILALSDSIFFCGTRQYGSGFLLKTCLFLLAFI